MILSGTTTFCDMYLFEDAVAQAAKTVGIRAVVGEVIYDFPSPNYGPVEAGLKYTEDLIEKWRDDPLITIAVEPHSVYVCSPELLQKARAIADKNDVPLIIHVAHNPESNMKLASGIAPIPELLDHGIIVGIGTDGCASNNNLDLFQEMDTAAKLHKVDSLDPTVMDARTVVRMATIDGARVLGLEDTTGSLETGKKADVIIVDVNRPHLIPMYNVYSHLVYAVTGSDVVTAIVNGRLLMEDRVLTTVDVDAVMRAVNQIAQDIT